MRDVRDWMGRCQIKDAVSFIPPYGSRGRTNPNPPDSSTRACVYRFSARRCRFAHIASRSQSETREPWPTHTLALRRYQKFWLEQSELLPEHCRRNSLPLDSTAPSRFCHDSSKDLAPCDCRSTANCSKSTPAFRKSARTVSQ